MRAFCVPALTCEGKEMEQIRNHPQRLVSEEKKKENTTSLPVPEITLKDLFLKRDSESRRDISSLSVPEIKKGLKDD